MSGVMDRYTEWCFPCKHFYMDFSGWKKLKGFFKCYSCTYRWAMRKCDGAPPKFEIDWCKGCAEWAHRPNCDPNHPCPYTAGAEP
jgi:hypothetical protein